MNKSSLIKWLLCLFLCTNLNISMAQNNVADVKIIKGGKDLPIELNLLLQSLQSNSPSSLTQVRTSAFNIDRYAQSLTREDVFLLGKIEIYRTFLKTSGQASNNPIDGNSLRLLQDSLNKTSDPFFKWFLSSLIEDTRILLDNSQFKEYILQQNAPQQAIAKYRRIIKKNQLLQNWIQQLSPDTGDFNDRLKALVIPKMEEALKSIENSYFMLAFHGGLKPLVEPITTEENLKFFTFETNTPLGPAKKDSESNEKSVEDILNPVLSSPPADLPAPSNENWLEEENTPSNLKNLPKASNDADWLQDF